MRRPFLMSALLVPLLLSPAIAEAGKTTKDFTYSYNVIWSSTVRLLRADLSYPIKEKDKETGFILFAYPGRNKTREYGGSMEILNFVDDKGFRRTKVLLEIGGQPSYVELHILDKLESKLLAEQGAPPKPVQVRKKKTPKKPEEKEKEKGK